MTRLFLTRLLPLFVLLSLPALLLGAGATAAQEPALPSYEPAPCPFEVPQGRVAECGYLTVAEDRANPDGATVRLAVAVFKAQGSSPLPDPVVYLEGGPGGAALDTWGPSFDFAFGLFNENRDVILYDQRGNGYSEPVLDCPGYSDAILQAYNPDLSDAESSSLFNEAVLACRDRLVEEGIDLSTYTSATNAADFNDLIQALGYEQVNLYGISYGTRLGLTIMRDFPGLVRSAILDSVVAPHLDEDAAGYDEFVRVFELMFERCEDDPSCAAAFPNLKDTLFEIYDQLEAEPVSLTTSTSGGETITFDLDGDLFLGFILYQSFYISSVIPDLPQVIINARDGNYDAASFLAGIFLDDTGLSEGTLYTVSCNEETAFSSAEAMIAEYDGEYPEWERVYQSDDFVAETGWFERCDRWRGGASEVGDIENQPVVSDIPALVMSGEFDPVTPPSNGQAAADYLANSVHLVFPGLGHGVSVGDACAAGLMLDFLNDPTAELDTACVDAIEPLRFNVPFMPPTVSEVTLQPYSDDDLGVSAVVPEGWQEVEPGVFIFTSESPTSLAFRVPEDGLEGYQQRIILGAYGYEELPESEALEVNGRTWDVYSLEGQGVFSHLALTEIDGQGYVVGVVASSPEEREQLYDLLLLPALEAFEPLG